MAQRDLAVARRDIDDLDVEALPAHLRIADALRRRIAFGVYTPGQRLPSERELARALGAGRMTVRAAVRVLAGEGLLETTRGRSGGTFVTNRKPRGRRGSRGRSRAIEDAAEEVRQTYEFRLVVEPRVSGMCAERAPDEAIAEITRIAATETTEVAQYRALDSRFHLALAEACGNRFALDSLKTVRAEFFQWADAFFDLEWSPQLVWSQTSMQEHRAIAAAISRRRTQAAERLMADHLRSAADIYEQIVTRGRLPEEP